MNDILTSILSTLHPFLTLPKDDLKRERGTFLSLSSDLMKGTKSTFFAVGSDVVRSAKKVSFLPLEVMLLKVRKKVPF